MRGRDTQTGSPGDRERYTDRFTNQVRRRDTQMVHQVKGRDTQTGSPGERERFTDRVH